MRLIVHVPDEVLESVEDRLPPPEMGVLEAVALDAILGFLTSLEADAGSPFSKKSGEPSAT
jgi:hypothetical protein